MDKSYFTSLLLEMLTNLKNAKTILLTLSKLFANRIVVKLDPVIVHVDIAILWAICLFALPTFMEKMNGLLFQA